MARNPKHFYDFGAYRVDEAERLLLRGDEVVPLTPKAFDILLVLVESSGHVLTKDELMKRVWPDTIVEEANLSHNIYKLREALGDSTQEQRYIKTIPRRGYRFVADVREVTNGELDLLVQETSQSRIVIEEQVEPPNVIDVTPAPFQVQPAPALLEGKRAKRRNITILLAIVALMASVLVVYYFVRKRNVAPVQAQQFRSLAVLPLKPLGAASSDDAYLGPGLADALITRLSNVRQIVVRPTSAVLKYASPQADLVAVAREQQVDAVLDGSFQRAGERVRVTIQLVRGLDGSPLWAETFDEKFTDIFAVQDTISAKVADALALKLSGSERKLLERHYTENTEAYQLYLKGRFYWLGSKTEERMRKSIEYFNRAIEVDPNYALAYSGLADGYVVLGTFYVMAPKEAFAKAKVAATKAVQLDDTLAEAHASISIIKLLHEFDWPGYEREYRRVIELNPNYATAHYEYAQYLAAMGRFEEATREGKRAQELDPISVTFAEISAWMFYFARDYDGAIAEQRKVVEFDPNNFAPHRRLGLAYLQKKMNAEALAEIQQSRALSGGNAEEIGYLGYAYAVTGKRAAALKVLDELQEQSQHRYVSPYLIALIHTGLSNKDQAFIWLEKAYEDRSVNLMYLKVEPILDPLRSDPRYADLMRRMNLTP